MARYRPEHKESTRRRMIAAAGRRFKADGIDGSGIATLVADAGLTNGAFYGHFSSKDDLVASVVAQQLRDQVASLESLPAGIGSVEDFVRGYLSAAHRDDLPGGCPSAALLDEIGRSRLTVREAYTEGTRAIISAIAHLLGEDDPPRSRERAVGLFALLVGAMQAARAVTDPALSDDILDTAYRNAMILAGARPGTPTSPQKEEA